MDLGRRQIARLFLVGGAAGLFIVGAPARARADNKEKATVLVQQADHALDQAGCFRADRVQTGCGDVAIFKSAAAKYDQAVKLYPSCKAAYLACYLHKKAQGPDLEWSKSSGNYMIALARCDYAAFHPDCRDEVRKQARSAGDEMRSELRFSRSKEEYDARVTAAAKALYGVGLKMKYDKGAGKISLDYGEVDAATLQGYIGEFYAGYAPKVLERVGMGFFLDEDRTDEYRALLAKGVLGWVLLEPRAKFRICKQMAYRMKQGGRELESWCLFQSVIEANAPLFAFKGSSVTWNARDLEGGGLAYTDRIFFPTIDGKYEPVVTIAGPIEVDDRKHINYQLRVANDVKSSNPHYQDALGLKARVQKIVKKKEAAFAKAEKKVRGRKGNVLFAEATFKSWTLPKFLAQGAVADCDKLHYKAYAPAGKNDEFHAEYKVDGETCNVHSVSSSEDSQAVTDSLMHPFAPRDDGCPAALLVPGDHEVVINMYPVKAAKTGYKEITRDWKIRDEYMGYWGKKVGSWKAKCTTNGSGSGSRFE